MPQLICSFNTHNTLHIRLFIELHYTLTSFVARVTLSFSERLDRKFKKKLNVNYATRAMKLISVL